VSDVWFLAFSPPLAQKQPHHGETDYKKNRRHKQIERRVSNETGVYKREGTK